jgi:hypothetical protein
MRHARHHFVAHALLVQEERLFSALIEEKRIAPLQPRHGLAFARFFGEQVTDRILVARLGRRAADVDPLGVLRRNRQQLGIHEMIEDHHVRLLQATVAAQGDEVGRAGTGANQVNRGSHGGILQEVPGS